MSPPERDLPAAHRVRRLSAYRAVRGAVLQRLRASPAARTLVHRAFALLGPPNGAMGALATPVHGRFPPVGRLLAGRGVEQLPVALVSLIGTPADRVAGTLEEVARLQLLTAGFRPVVLLAGPHLAAVRRYGWAAELLVARDAWPPVEQSWEEYAAVRLDSVVRTYRPAVLVEASADGLGDAARTLLSGLATT